MKTLALATCAALALSATGASANGYWQDGIYYSYITAPTQSTTSYVAPTTTYTVPSYTAPTYSQPTYIAPSSTTTYTPVYNTTPSYIAPAPIYSPTPGYTVPVYDGRDRVRQRIRNQRNRIERALSRGDLRRGEERRLREGLRDIRQTFRAYRDNDSVLGRHETAHLMQMLDRNGQRIRRLANNDRVARGPRRGPYAY